ncbi:MAG: hypothetical protein IKL68_01220 [Clostridia bacterium]|nr:hypothetical protein [Clostridia bacterium]
MGADVLNNLNILLEKLFGTVETEVFKMLDKLYKITPEILEEEPLKSILSKSTEENVTLILFSLIILFIIFYLITYMVSLYSGNYQENVFKFVFKLTVFFILSSSSIFIMETILDLNNMLTDVILNIGEDITKKEIAFESLKESILDVEKYMSKDAISIDGIIKGVVSIGASSILITLLIRYVTVIILIILSPIAIMLSVNSSTTSLFFAWLKSFLVNILSQNLIAIILIIPLSFKNTEEIMYKIILAGSIYLLYKINSFARELINISGGINARK